MPDSDLALLIDAAKAAGEIARRFWRKSPEAWEKEAGAGPVTEADLAVNAMLEAELRRARPEYGWLSEESADESARLAAERCFIIDPIDGTRAFIEGSDGFSHSLAVVERGVPVAACVFVPMREEMFTATLSGPATLNGAPIRARSRPLGEANVLTAAASFHPVHWRRDQIPPLTRAFRSSIAWRLCLVAQGAFDSAMSLRPAWEWDIAAGALIAERAGARATDRMGGALRFNRSTPQANGLVCAADPLHSEIIARLAPFPA